MLDTLGIGCEVEGLSVGRLLDAGWDVHTVTNSQGGQVSAVIEYGGARLCYKAGVAWLGIEASLPALLAGDNSVLLDAAGCREGAVKLCELACTAVGCDLPALGDWKVSRFDPVWAWPCDPAPYIGALTVARLPRTEGVRYGSSVRWVTRTGRVRARCYDKKEEQGRDVDLPLRLERQVRRREVVRDAAGGEVGRRVDDVLADGVCVGIVRGAVAALGLDRPIPTLQATKRVLIEMYGRRRGLTAWAVLRDVIDCGGVWPGHFGVPRRRQYEKLWRDAGVSVSSPVGELPPLVV